MRVNGNIVLNDNASGEIRHVYIERLDNTAMGTVASTLTTANTGRLVFNTTTGLFNYWTGTAFLPLATSTNIATVQAELDRLELSLGNFINADGTFTATAVDALLNVDVSTATSLVDVLVALDKAIKNIDVSAQIQPIKDEIDAIEAGAGLASDGKYVADATTTYLTAATSLKDADKKLDAAAKANADAIVANKTASDTAIAGIQTAATNLQAEVDAIEAGAGLGTDGKYTANTADHYIAAATSLKDADDKLDAAIKVNADAVAANTAAIATKQDALGFVPVNKAGDSVNGNLSFGGTSTVKNLAAPVDSTDAVRKIDLENAVAGLDFQADVLGNEADFVSGTSVAGRYILGDGSKFTGASAKGAAAGDIVEVDATGAVTKLDYDVSVAGPGAMTWNRNSSVWYQWNGTAWSVFGGLSGVTAGTGLLKDGNTLSVKLGAGVADLPTGEVGLDLKVNGGLQLVDPTTGDASTGHDAVLAAKVGTGLEVTSAGVAVKAAGISATELAASVAGNGLQGGAGTALTVKAGTGVVVDANGVAVDQTFLNGKYLSLTGGTLTGALVLAGDATAALQPVTKQQLDAAEAADAAALSAAITGVNTKITSVVASLNKTYFTQAYTTTGASAAINVVHNLGVKYCNVTVVDSDDEVFIPQSIKFIDANTLQVTLNTDISGTVVVMGHAALTL